MAIPNAQGYYLVNDGDNNYVWYGPDGNRAYGYTPPVAAPAPRLSSGFVVGGVDGLTAPSADTQQQMRGAFGQWTPDRYSQGLTPDLLNGVRNAGWRTAPDADLGGNHTPGAFVMGANGEIQYHPQGQGPGEQYYVYDGNTGKFLRTDTGSKSMSYWQGLLGVAGAALGFGALGAATAGGTAAGTATGTATGTGAATTAGGAGVTGFGDAGTMYAGSTAGDAATLGGGGSFTGAGMGSTYAGGATAVGAGAGGGGAGSSIVPGVSNSTLTSLGTTALGALGKSPGVPDLTGDEAARQAKLQSAIDAINEKFGYGSTPGASTNKTARDSMYSDISGAVSEAAMRDLNKQFTTASNRNTFGLARSGLMGGSVDAESGADLQQRYGEGKMKATQAGLGAASDLRSQDEQTRQRLISLAQSGLDAGTANSMAASEMQSAADSARANAAGTTAGRLFDDMSQAYTMNNYLKARYPNGVGQPTRYTSNPLFGTTRYTGQVQG